MSVLQFAIDAKKYGYLNENLKCQKTIIEARESITEAIENLNNLSSKIAYLEEQAQGDLLTQEQFADLEENGRVNQAKLKLKGIDNLLLREQNDLSKKYTVIKGSSKTTTIAGGVK